MILPAAEVEEEVVGAEVVVGAQPAAVAVALPDNFPDTNHRNL